MSDAIDDLARRLFEAARDERPDAELIARVHARSDVISAPPAPQRLEPESGLRLVRRSGGPRAHRLRWLAMAAVLAGGLVVAQLRAPVSDVRISAEAQPAQRHSAPPTRAAEPEPPVPAIESVAARSVAPPPARVPTRKPSAHAAHAAPSVPPMPPEASATPTASEAAPVPRAPLSAQLELLKRARSLLRSGDGAGALEAVERYGSDLHGIELKDEAELLRIEALSALGRTSEATALARRFVTDHPDSPLAERAQRFIRESRVAPAPTGSP